MEFLKKHYEKILLSVVLLGLGAAAFWLPNAIKQADADSKAAVSTTPRPKGVPALDFDKDKVALQAITNRAPLVLSGEHNLFNPVTWKMKADGSLMKVMVEGAAALTITNIHPLYTILSYDRSAGTGFYISVQLQSGKKKSEYAKLNEKDKMGMFTVLEAKGPPEDPTELVLELPDTMEKVSITKAQPFQRVDGYAADFRYEPEAKTFNNKRVNDWISFDGETYKIIAITNNAVRLMANSTTKQTSITWTGTP
jgi:hypothetical protein